MGEERSLMKKAVGPSRKMSGGDVRPDRQLASLFRLQPTPDNICENKTRYVAKREGCICILSLRQDEEREED